MPKGGGGGGGGGKGGGGGGGKGGGGGGGKGGGGKSSCSVVRSGSGGGRVQTHTTHFTASTPRATTNHANTCTVRSYPSGVATTTKSVSTTFRPA